MQPWPHLPVIKPRAAWIAAPIGTLLATSAVMWSETAPLRQELPPRFRAVGTLHSEGLPAAGAVLTFHPVDTALLVYPRAVVQADGSFEVRTPYFGSGAPAAEYTVTVSWRPQVVSGEHYGPGPNVAPTAYADPAITPLRATVARQSNQLPAWSMPRLHVSS